MTIEEFLRKWHYKKTNDGYTIVEKFTVQLDESSTAIGVYVEDRLALIEYQVECEISYPRSGIVKASSQPVGPKLNESQDERMSKVLESLNDELDRQVKYARNLSKGNPLFGKPVMVVLLGAGFSKAFDFPVTKGIRKDSLQLCSSPSIGHPPSFKETLSMYPVLEFAKEENSKIPDIEYLLTLWNGYIDQLKTSDENEHAQELWRYCAFLQNLTCHLFRYGNQMTNKPEREDRFKALVEWIKPSLKKYDIRFLTFNYDLIGEKLLKRAGIKHCYLGRSNENTIPIRKLHGSINWFESSGPLRDYDLLYDNQDNYIHCSQNYKSPDFSDPLNPPIIIPPYAQKKYDGLLDYIWRFALGDLRTAEKVLIIGYSFPPLDVIARVYLQSEIKNLDKTILYINKNKEDCKRVKTLLGLQDEQIISERWKVDHLTQFVEQ